MKAIVQTRYGSPDTCTLEDVDDPVPASGEVTVRIRAASLNARDWHLMRGDPYLARLAPGFGLRAPTLRIRGSDFAGTVEAVGSDVTRLHVGDEVYGAARRRARGVRVRAGVAGDPQAVEPHVRAGRGHADGGDDGAAGVAGSRRCRAEHPRQRRLRGSRDVRRAAGARLGRRGHGRVQHPERRPRALPRCRPRRRLHARRRAPSRPSLRRAVRPRRQPLPAGPAPRPDAHRDADPVRRRRLRRRLGARSHRSAPPQQADGTVRRSETSSRSRPSPAPSTSTRCATWRRPARSCRPSTAPTRCPPRRTRCATSRASTLARRSSSRSDPPTTVRMSRRSRKV